MAEGFSGQIEGFEEARRYKLNLKGGGWLMVRSSGTERKVRVYVESPNEAEARELLDSAVEIAVGCVKKE